MSVALLNVFEDDIASHILGFSGNLPAVEWEELYGKTLIFKTSHFITYGGESPCIREHAAGWCEWRRAWRRNWTESGVSYGRTLDGLMACKWLDDGCERIGKLPLDWDRWDWAEGNEDTAIVIMDDDHMQAQDE